MASREIKLNGGEISILKKIGLSGSPVFGKLLVEKIEEMETGEFLDTLAGLIDQNYVLSNKVNVRTIRGIPCDPGRRTSLVYSSLRAGRKQLFGTKFREVDGELVPYPIEKESEVDARRKQAELEPLAAYARRLRRRFAPRRTRRG